MDRMQEMQDVMRRIGERLLPAMEREAELKRQCEAAALRAVYGQSAIMVRVVADMPVIDTIDPQDFINRTMTETMEYRARLTLNPPHPAE